jgi:hypothetical protein
VNTTQSHLAYVFECDVYCPFRDIANMFSGRHQSHRQGLFSILPTTSLLHGRVGQPLWCCLQILLWNWITVDLKLYVNKLIMYQVYILLNNRPHTTAIVVTLCIVMPVYSCPGIYFNVDVSNVWVRAQILVIFKNYIIVCDIMIIDRSSNWKFELWTLALLKY